jgi:H+/Cl- antiporter ClcA
MSDNFFSQNTWLIYVLPAGGLIIALMYNVAGIRNVKGLSRVLDGVRGDDEIPFYIAPVIYLSTIITHICGGSAGREGAALQIGGSMGEFLGKLFGMDENDMAIMILSGAAAMFSALFCTPLAATVFAMEVVSVGVMYYSALLPCLASSLVAYTIARMAGLSGTGMAIVSFPDIDIMIVIKVAVLGLFCAALSAGLVVIFDHTRSFFVSHFKNRYLRLAIGGCCLILLTLVFPSGNYNGSGMPVIMKALGGNTDWYSFLVKLLFTAVCLGSGYKGGEIVPTFFIGATMGCWAGGLLGLDPGFAAAVGLVATFCGAVNCPIASIILGIELFGGGGIIYFAVACAISFLMSGYYSLYSSQKIMYSKTTAKFINKKAK